MSSLLSHSFRGAAAPLAILMLMGASSVQAETIDRATLLAEAPDRCVAAAQERYGVSEDDVTVRSKPSPKYRSGLKGVAVPLRVYKKNRNKSHTCVALKNGGFDFYQGTP